MLKRSLKISILTFFVIILLTSILKNVVYADGAYSGKMTELITTMDSAQDSDAGDASTKVKNIVAIVVTVARIAGVIIAVVMLLAVAMKYMTAAPGEKADIKKSAVAYVVGAIVLFAVTGILGIINSFASKIS